MAKKKQETKAIEKKVKQTNIVSTDRPEWMTGQFDEQMDADELLIPRIDVAQALSPQLDEEEPNYIEGLKQGDLFNSATGYVYGREVKFVSIGYKKEWLLFQDRKQGGGFGGTYPTEAVARDAISDLDGEGWEPTLALSNIVMILDAEGNNTEVAYLSCTRTKIKPARKMNTYLQMVNAPRFATVFALSPVKATNAQGEHYWNINIAPDGWLGNRDTYEEASKISAAMSGKEVKGDHTSSAPAEESEF